MFFDDVIYTSVIGFKKLCGFLNTDSSTDIIILRVKTTLFVFWNTPDLYKKIGEVG